MDKSCLGQFILQLGMPQIFKKEALSDYKNKLDISSIKGIQLSENVQKSILEVEVNAIFL